MNNKLQFTSHERRATRDEFPIGSALIIAVILTSLLAIIGVMFVMIARVDKMATSAISENKELNFAVETVVALVSQELVLDVPGVAGQEYYDYPDANNAWLANLEPYDDSGTYKWRRISDIYNRLDANNLQAIIIPDYQKPSDVGDGSIADADGDGVADSKWVELEDINSNKGKPIYAAVRVVDNGAMLNVNTAYKFDPTETDSNLIDGSNQSQINLAALRRGTTKPFSNLDDMRKGGETWDLDRYIDDVVWQIERPAGLWTPFDISDELKLRNRYILNYNLMVSRIEGLWTKVYDWGPRDPLPTTSYPFSRWPNCTILGTVEPNDDYDYRHISTTYNMDRIITPDCNKMTNINTADVDALYSSVRRGLLDTNYPDANIAAQIAVNLVDYRDNDSDVTAYTNPDDGRTYYGFESPCIYISELAHIFKKDVVDPTIVYKSYAVELYKPYTTGDGDPNPAPNNWWLVIDGINYIGIDWSEGSKRFYVVRDPCANAPLPVDPSGILIDFPVDYPLFNAGSVISLLRFVNGVGIVVDSIRVPDPSGDWWAIDGSAHSIQRDITLHKCIRRLWDSNTRVPNLGNATNNYIDPNSRTIQAHPANKNFTNIGEIGMLFRKPAYYEDGQPVPSSGVIGYSIDSDTEEGVRLDLADLNFQQLFKYLTVFDPNSDTIDNDGDGLIDALDTDTPEYKVPGRININTAPWYVLAQLPWVSQRKGGTDYSLAQAIVAYRDKLDLLPIGGPDYSGQSREPGFRNIGELNRVVDGSNDYCIDYYKLDSDDLAGFPDLTTLPTGGDGAKNDFEERDVIFARISNLVTVRSDVFTAYILVRIGKDGPQKRVMAILDRSNVYSGGGKVRIIALHPVPDPR